jgi:hypothetical protein
MAKNKIVNQHNDIKNNNVTIMTEQAVQRLATVWTAEELKFESPLGQVLSTLHVVQTGPGAHQASYPMGTGVSFPVGKAPGA